MDFARYQTGGFYDEMFDTGRRPRPGYELLARTLATMPDNDLVRRQRAAERALLNMGITFNVYGHEAGAEKILPFDLLPRVVHAEDWTVIERGLVQRARALDLVVAATSHLAAKGWTRRAASGCTSAGPTSCATRTAATTSSRTTSAALPACRTYCTTAR